MKSKNKIWPICCRSESRKAAAAWTHLILDLLDLLNGRHFVSKLRLRAGSILILLYSRAGIDGCTSAGRKRKKENFVLVHFLPRSSTDIFHQSLFRNLFDVLFSYLLIRPVGMPRWQRSWVAAVLLLLVALFVSSAQPAGAMSDHERRDLQYTATALHI
jgi:hypothetical protein